MFSFLLSDKVLKKFCFLLKNIFIGLSLFSIGLASAGAYEQQGFESFSETSGGITFACKNQCFVVLGATKDIEVLSLGGSISGNGEILYGFFDGTQVIPGEAISVTGAKQDITFFPHRFPYFSQVPKKSSIVLIFIGALQGQDIEIQARKMGLGETLGNLWQSFWKVETLTPYSINLRYGVFLGNTSIVVILSVLCFCIFLLSFSLPKKYQKHLLWYAVLFCFLFLSMRNLYSYGNIVTQGLREFHFQETENKKFFDLGDYIVFTQKIRETLQLDTKNPPKCVIYLESARDWPFESHWDFVYLRPCTVTQEKEEAQYSIYYGVVPETFSGTILLQTDTGLLLQR